MEKEAEKENKNLAASVLKKGESAAAAALLLSLSHHSSSLSLSSPPLILRALKEEVNESSICSEETTVSSSCVSDACSASTCEDPLKFLASAAVDRIFVGYKVVRKCRSKIQQKKIIHNKDKMRVVYDLLKHGDRRIENNVASTVFSFPKPTSATRHIRPKTGSLNCSTNTVGDDRTSPVTFDAPPSSSMVSSTTRSNKRFIRKKYKDASSVGSSSTSCRSSTKTAKTNSSIQRKADDILNWLSVNGMASEGMIRYAVGDTPDTSKALRLLVKNQEVSRSGVGGRTNPYFYMVVSKEAIEN